MRQLAFIPFSAFSPDGPAHGPGLDLAQNVIPIHGGYRSLEKESVQSQLDFLSQPFDERRPGGLFVHVFQQSRTGSWLRPSSDDTAGIWVPSEGEDLWEMIDEESAIDSTRIIAGGAPSAQVCKIALADPVATPAVDTDHVLRWRYAVLGTPSGSWSVKVELLQGTTVVGGATPVEEEQTGTADEDFVSSEIALSTAQAATITDYDDLYLRFTATVPGAVQFLRPDGDDSVGGWQTQAGAITNLYQTIDESTSSDADYIHTGALSAGSTKTYRATLGSPTIDPRRSSGHVVRYRYYAEQAGLTLVVKLKQGTTEVASNTHAAITAGSWIAGTFTLSSGETDAITDYDDLLLEAVASFPTAITATETQEARPTSDIVSGFWRRSDTSSYDDVWEMVDEAVLDTGDSADYFYPVSPQIAGEPHEWGLSALTDPLRHDGHELYIALRSPFNDSILYNVKLKQAEATIASWGFQEAPVSGSLLEKTLTISVAEAATITDYSGLSVEVSSTSNDAKVYMVELRVPALARLRLSWAELEVPSAARAEVSWAELEVPAADAEYQGDVPTIYLGEKAALYVVDDIAFEDVSRAAGYGGGGSKPGGWYFTSWGNDTIATNYTDPVQIRRDQTGDFADMMTSTLKPKGRFVMVVRNHVVLLDINLTGHAAHEVWWSAFEDETDFDPALATQSDFQPLLSTQGQIMGGVGGEYGVIFKRNAIHLMTATGTSSVFRFDEVSRGIGTPFPRSIVRAEGMIYFWDGSTFRRTTGFEQPERVGSEVLSRFMTDHRFEEHALRVFEPANILDEDQAMVAAYDSSAGVITWSYAAAEDPTSQKTRQVHYNPAMDAWSFSHTEGFGGLADLAQMPNVSNSDVHTLKGTIFTRFVQGFQFGGWSGQTAWLKWSGANTFEATFRTKRLTLGDDDTRSARVTGVIPIFRIAGETEALPVHLSITMEAANDPRFLVNVRSETYDTTKANEYGEFPHQLEGKWFKFTVTVPEMESRALTSFVGLYVEWEPGGQA